MSKQYIELTSTYRNRNVWSKTSEFEVDFARPNVQNLNNAVDPVSDQAPIKVWKSNDFNTGDTGASIVVTVVSIGTGRKSIIVKDNTAGVKLQTTNDYYNGTIAAKNTDISELSRIVKYTYLYTDGIDNYAEIELQEAYGPTLAVNDGITISDPTTTAGTDFSYFFVPDGSVNDNAYVGFYLYNETDTNYAEILDYDSVTRRVKVKTKGTWTTSEDYCIRKTIPQISKKNITVTSNVFDVPVGVDVSDKSLNFIRVVGTSDYYRIISRNVTDKNMTLGPKIGSTPPTPLSGANNVEFLSTTYDNNSPMQFSGSIASQTQLVCHEIELINLVLPNLNIKHHRGGRIANHPYVYVELSNVSSGSNRNIIYSNNPNAKKAVFRCAVRDISEPNSSPYIKLDGDYMVQTIKFKPTDRLYFSVKMPDGTPFEVEEEETFNPLPPNPEIQLSALFSIRRIE